MASPVTAILGLGREVGDAVARRFHELGHNVLAADSSGDRLLTAQNAMPEKVLLHLGDLHTKLGLRNAVAAAVEGFGRIDNLVIIPSIEDPDTIHDFSQERFDKALAKTVRGRGAVAEVFAERIAEQADLRRPARNASASAVRSPSSCPTPPCPPCRAALPSRSRRPVFWAWCGPIAGPCRSGHPRERDRRDPSA